MGDGASNDELFSVREVAGGRLATITLHTRYLNYSVSDALRASLARFLANGLERGLREFVLELTSVTIVDSCGVGLMIWLHREVEAAGGTLCLCGVTHFLQKMLRMMQLDRFFTVVATEEEAVRRLATRVE